MTDRAELSLGILGGTFNPIHHGHLRVAVECIERLQLDRLHLVPLNAPAHRDAPETDAALRFEMVQRAVNEETQLIADDRELRRGGVSYTVDTLEAFRADYPQAALSVIIGTDAFAHLHRWHRWEDLSIFAHIIVVHRPGSDLPTDTPAYEMLEPMLTGDPADLRKKTAGCFVSLSLPMLDISSTQIRSILHNKQSPRYLLPKSVLDLIHEQQLYI